jgi:hypothetical protein
MATTPRNHHLKTAGAGAPSAIVLLTAVVLAMILATVPLRSLAAARTQAVTSPSATAANTSSAIYSLAGAPQTLLAAGQDPRLRVQAFGDIATASHIAVLVPGMGHTTAEFDSQTTAPAAATPSDLPGRARALLAAMNTKDPTANAAVVAWLGYEPPADAIGALGADRIAQAAANLVAFQGFLTSHAPGSTVTWICHSYGSLVCAAALNLGVPSAPAAVALVGSPGVQVSRAADLPTAAAIYAARGDADPIILTQLMAAAGADYGPDPASPEFGAHLIDCPTGTGHSDYFKPASPQLAALASIALGDS